MAKQRGIVFLEGTIGGVNFYYRKGVPTARIAGGGFTREAIKKGANMVRVRESNDEFADCSTTNKVFKHAIRPFTLGYKDGTLHGRLMRLFLKIKDCDAVSPRGKRSVFVGMASNQGQQLLKGFAFTPKRTYLFPCTYRFDWSTLTLGVSGFKVTRAGFPKEASYMEVLLGVIRFDFETRTYRQVIEAPLVIERHFSEETFNLAVPELPDGEGVLFSMVRVAFYQEVNGEGYLLPGGDGFGVEVVGVEG